MLKFQSVFTRRTLLCLMLCYDRRGLRPRISYGYIASVADDYTQLEDYDIEQPELFGPEIEPEFITIGRDIVHQSIGHAQAPYYGHRYIQD